MTDVWMAALAWTLACGPPTCELPETETVSAAHAQTADPWLGHDKFTHAGVSWATTVFGFAAGVSAGLAADDALAVALPVTLALGIGKELRDQRTSFFSVRDLVADVAGMTAAYFFLREVR